jgi:hypothetical protein
MEMRLRANDHKGGWYDCTLQYLKKRLHEEVMELRSSRRDTRVEEAADVANFAMMIADREYRARQ